MFNVWDRIEENEFADVVTNALAEIFPTDPPRFLARTPHGYHDAVLIRDELLEAGFSSVVIETRAEHSHAASPRIQQWLIVRELFFVTKLRPEKREDWKPQPTTPHPRLRTDMATARSPPRFRHT